MALGGIALKSLAWFVRSVQLGCCIVVLALTSYFLATLHNHEMTIATWLRAVEGISGVGIIYTAVALLLLCFLAGRVVTGLVAILLDVAFIGAFIYSAYSYRGGASTCRGDVDTPFGRGNADTNVPENANDDGFTNLPSFYNACKVDTAALAVCIIAIFFFLFSIFVELLLMRHHRNEKKYGTTSKHTLTSEPSTRRKPGMFSFRRKNRAATNGTENGLPEHTQPTQLNGTYGTETNGVTNGTNGNAAATNSAWHTGAKTNGAHAV